MSNPQQYYDLGQPITLSSYNQLSDYDSETWVWKGRKFEYYLSSDGVTRLDQGTLATFKDKQSQISAIWSMDNSVEPIKIYLSGENGEVSVLVKEINRDYPLGSFKDTYLCSYLVTNVQTQKQTLSSITIKRQPDDTESIADTNGSQVQLSVSCTPKTKILSVYWGNVYLGENFENIRSGRHDSSVYRYNWEHLSCQNDRTHGLSVYFKDNVLVVKFFVDSQLCGEPQYVNYGQSAIKPADPIKTGYTFISWDKNDDVLAEVKEDLSVNAIFQINSHAVTFKDYDDSIIETQTKEYGSQVTYPTHPNDREDYDPNGWDPAQINSMPDNDVEVSALYKIKQYSVKFIDDAGKADFINPEQHAGTYDIHSEIEYPEVSCKAGYDYECEPEEIIDLTTDTSVYLRSYGKGLAMVAVDLSGDAFENTIRLNDCDHLVSNPNYSLVDKGNGISTLTLYELDLEDGSEFLYKATSAFVDLKDKLQSINYLNYTHLSSIDDMANGCSSLTQASLVELTALKTADRMFKDCVNLTHLSIPNNPTIIERLNDEDTFENCENLSLIRYYGKLSSYQANNTLSLLFGEATYLSVDPVKEETYSNLSGGLYGQTQKTLITTAGNIVTLKFITESIPGSQSNVPGNQINYESYQCLGNIPEPSFNGYRRRTGTNGWVYENGNTLLNVDVITTDTSCYIAMEAITYTIYYERNEGIIGESIKVNYTINDRVTLPTQITKTYFDFNGWYDNPDFNGEAITEILSGNTGDKYFYAKWTKQTRTLNAVINTETYTPEGISVSYNDPTGGSVDGLGTYDINTTHTLTAVPSDGFEFKYWNDNTSNTDPIRTVTVDKNMTLSATFSSKNQSIKEYFNVAYDNPVETQATIIGLTEVGKNVIKYMDIPEKFEI